MANFAHITVKTVVSAGLCMTALATAVALSPHAAAALQLKTGGYKCVDAAAGAAPVAGAPLCAAAAVEAAGVVPAAAPAAGPAGARRSTARGPAGASRTAGRPAGTAGATGAGRAGSGSRPRRSSHRRSGGRRRGHRKGRADRFARRRAGGRDTHIARSRGLIGGGLIAPTTTRHEKRRPAHRPGAFLMPCFLA